MDRHSSRAPYLHVRVPGLFNHIGNKTGMKTIKAGCKRLAATIVHPLYLWKDFRNIEPPALNR
jgi:hypothetical protein